MNAVDGSSVSLDLEQVVVGRDRTGAAAGMTVAFGLVGMFTRGRMAYVEKGTLYTARTDAELEIAAWPPQPPVSIDDRAASGLTAPASLKPDRITLRIEKGREMPPLRLHLEAPEGYSFDAIDTTSLRVTRVGDIVLPEPVRPLTTVTEGRNTDDWSMIVLLDAWKIVSFCNAERDTVTYKIAGTWPIGGSK